MENCTFNPSPAYTASSMDRSDWITKAGSTQMGLRWSVIFIQTMALAFVMVNDQGMSAEKMIGHNRLYWAVVDCTYEYMDWLTNNYHFF